MNLFFSQLKFSATAITNTPNAESRIGPGHGTFLGTKEWYPNDGDFCTIDDKFEIGVFTRVIGGNRVCSIGMYRSPNMKLPEIEAFYGRLRHHVTVCRREKADIIVLSGDDNSHSTKTSGNYNKKAFACLEEIRRRFGGVHVVNKPTHKNYQPDHVIVFCDPLRYKVTSINPTPGVGDHCEMRFWIDLGYLGAPKPKWERRLCVESEGDEKSIREDLAKVLEGLDLNFFLQKHLGKRWCLLELDHILSVFHGRVAYVRLKNRIVKWRRMACYPGVVKTKSEREVQVVINKISKAEANLKKYPSSAKLKEKVHDLHARYVEVAAQAGRNILEFHMAKMGKNRTKNPSRFFAQASRHLSFGGAENLMSDEAIQRKLTDAEKNYLLPEGCPKFSLEEYEDIEPDAYFDIKPSLSRTRAIIGGLNKVDPFYKKYAEQLAPALTLILEIVNQTHLFPTSCKISKLTFLPKRTIFSLDFMAKFIERAIQNAFDEVKPADRYGQFAYQPNRSCELVVAIGLNEVEKAGVPCVGFGLDAKKAFDTARWSTMGRVLQQQCNGGRLWYNYCQGRTYRFRGKHGFQRQPMGRGAPPGAILAPSAFAGFQTTDTEMTCLGKTGAWVWPGLFSDDKNPIGTVYSLRSGRIQAALNSSVQWSKDNFVNYHMTGDKKPVCYVFRSNSQSFQDSELSDLRFDGQPIDRAYVNWQLGFCQRFFDDDFTGYSGTGKCSRDPAKTGAYEYFLDWTAAREGRATLNRLGHRFQDVKHVWSPDFVRTTLRSFMLGKIHYGAALFWLRGSTDSIEETRYYYCMAMAACMGLEAPEVTGLVCSAKGRVTATNNGYIKACKFLDLPTLEDTAISNARNIIRQWSFWDPAAFTYFEKTAVVDGVADGAVENKLLFELIELGKKRRNAWWPEYYKVKYKMDKRAEFLRNNDNWDKVPSYKVYFRKASERTFAIWAESSEVPSSLDVNNTFKYMCRHHFNCLELGTRRKKRLGLVGMLGYTTAKKSHMSDSKKRKAPGPQTDRKKRRTVAFTCSAPIPKIRGRKQLPCRICGYAIPKNKSSVNMSCCNLSAHSLCWLNATESYREKNGPPNRPQCCMITSYRAKGGAELPDSAQLSASQRLPSPPRPSSMRGATRTQP